MSNMPYTNQNKNTTSYQNLAKSGGKTLGEHTFDEIGTQTFEDDFTFNKTVGETQFDEPKSQTYSNQNKNTTSYSNQTKNTV